MARRARGADGAGRQAAPALAAACLILSLGAPAAAQDEVQPLGEPLEVEDAIASRPGELELQGTAIHDRRRRGDPGRDGWPAELQAQLGLPRGLELRIGVRETFGNTEEARQGGAVRLAAFWQLTEERPGRMPALGVLVGIDPPFGPGGRGMETRVIGALSWRFAGPSEWRSPFRVHLNIGWLGRIDPAPDERPDRYRFAIGATQNFGPDTVLLAVLRHEQQDFGESDLTLLLAGLRQRIGHGTTIGLVGGMGFGPDSPAWRVAVGIEHQFTLGAR